MIIFLLKANRLNFELLLILEEVVIVAKIKPLKRSSSKGF